MFYAGENRYSFGRNRGANKFRYHKHFHGRNRSDQIQNDTRNKRTNPIDTSGNPVTLSCLSINNVLF